MYDVVLLGSTPQPGCQWQMRRFIGKFSKPKNPYYNPVGENRILAAGEKVGPLCLTVDGKKNPCTTWYGKKTSHCLEALNVSTSKVGRWPWPWGISSNQPSINRKPWVIPGPPSIHPVPNSTFLTFSVQADGIFKQLQQIILVTRRRRLEPLKVLVGFNRDPYFNCFNHKQYKIYKWLVKYNSPI